VLIIPSGFQRVVNPKNVHLLGRSYQPKCFWHELNAQILRPPLEVFATVKFASHRKSQRNPIQIWSREINAHFVIIENLECLRFLFVRLFFNEISDRTANLGDRCGFVFCQRSGRHQHASSPARSQN
jgi:hypothetical protein